MQYVQNTVRIFARFEEFAGNIELNKTNRNARSLRDVWMGQACRSGNRRQADEAAGQQEVAQDQTYGKEALRLRHIIRHVDSINSMRECVSTLFVCGSSVTMCIWPDCNFASEGGCIIHTLPSQHLISRSCNYSGLCVTSCSHRHCTRSTIGAAMRAERHGSLPRDRRGNQAFYGHCFKW
jgi:hypothetical protein